jgi:hypothetical protein
MSYNILRTSCSIDNTSARTSNQKFLPLYAPVYYIMNNCSQCLQDSNRIIVNNSSIENNKTQHDKEQKSEYLRKEMDRIRRDLHKRKMSAQAYSNPRKI